MARVLKLKYMWTAAQLRQKYRQFFESKGHKVIPAASLIPENDPTVLFTTAGMHPLVPYLMGEKHPAGARLTSVQKCIRTGDIEEVGDKFHLTFFEMLGNWSLGDYGKKEAIEYSFGFLTGKEWLDLDKDKLAVSVFAGDEDSPFDDESFEIWKKLGIPEAKIAKLGKKDNWWGPAGKTGPCGPDTEMFYWTGGEKLPDNFDAEDARWVEIWNDVFMQYYKTAEGKYESLKQKNVDTGMGLERTLAVLNGLDDVYRTDLLWPIIREIERHSSEGKKYDDSDRAKKAMRIIADHIRTAVMLVADGILPSKTEQGYVLRRLIRLAVDRFMELSIIPTVQPLVATVVENLQIQYPELIDRQNDIAKIIKDEAMSYYQKIKEAEMTTLPKFYDLLRRRGKTPPEVRAKSDNPEISDPTINNQMFEELGELAYDVARAEKGLPLEIIFEGLKKAGYFIFDEQAGWEHFKKGWQKAKKRHQELSRTASAGMFKGGLADDSEMAAKYHTATHLLQAALRLVLGEGVAQKGSNINSERMRFDFTYGEKMTPEQIADTERIVNEQIAADWPVMCVEMSLEGAKASGATGLFENKYGDKVKVYTIGMEEGAGPAFSKEICGGPHASRTGELGHFRILKEESSSAGVRRIKAVLE